jgi:hypothetical protein
MTIEPRVIRTLKKTYVEDHFMEDARMRKSVSDEILDIIYDKVRSKHECLDRKVGRGIKALIEDID